MVALPLFDAVLSSGQTPERSLRVGAQLVKAALDELAQIHQLEASLAPDDPMNFDRHTAALVRDMYERWAQETDLLMDRIGELESLCGPVPKAAALRDAQGRTRAGLSVSLDRLEKGLRDIAQGRTVSAEEVRRELRLRAG